MNFLKIRPPVFFLGLCLAITLVSVGPAFVASADSVTTVSLGITAGALNVTGPTTATASAVTLDGTPQTSTYSLPLTTNDATGSDAGWHLSVTSTLFTNGGGALLPPDASSITTAPTPTCSTPGTCTIPSNTVTYPVVIPAAATAPTAVPLFNATIKSGEGSSIITPTVTIAIPATASAGTYTSTVTVTATSGP